MFFCTVVVFLPTLSQQQPAQPELTWSEHIRYGIPGNTDRILDKQYFIIGYKDEWKIPEWVLYSVTKQELRDTTPRLRNFKPDPQLPPAIGAQPSDYKKSGYDQGHMAPATDFKRSKEAMATTFLLSNVAPQTDKLNERIWNKLEGQVRSKVKKSGKAWIVTGNVFLDDNWKPVPPEKFIGMDNVAVPDYCFKVILTEQVGGIHEILNTILTFFTTTKERLEARQ